MDEDDTKSVWFREKIFGFGYGPSSWQGWLLTALFAGLLVGTGKLANFVIPHYHLDPDWYLAVIGLFAVYLVGFLVVLYRHRGPA